MFKNYIFLLGLFFSISICNAQNEAVVYGKVIDVTTKEAVEFTNVSIKGTTKGSIVDAKGEYTLKVPSNTKSTILFTCVGYKNAVVNIPYLKVNEKYQVDVQMSTTETNIEVVVRARRIDNGGMVREKVTELKLIPNASGNFESVLPSIALGTNAGSGGELSSQYNVRGGNYDENLVYVNDFEIYRPQLVRAGQQEGLSFPNIDLMSNLSFSSGGFEAKYGDKLSSVLDIKYKRPDSLRYSLGGSLLGGSAHIEGSKKLDPTGYRRFRYLLGARYKTTKYLLGSQDVKGEYTPNFADIQTYLTYDLSKNWQVAFLGNFNNSVFSFIPSERNSVTGVINRTLNLNVLYDGQERDNFQTAMAGTSVSYIPENRRNPLYIKFLASAYNSQENEKIDITGDYRLQEIETNLGSSNFGKVIGEVGSGVQQQFVRNYLNSRVTNIEHKGGIEYARKGAVSSKTHFLQWSLRLQNEIIKDKLKEWERLDSALYSLEYDTTTLRVSRYVTSRNNLNSNRINASFQDTYTYRKDNLAEVQMTLGVRASYWDFNKEATITPRFQILYKPLNWSKDMSFRLSGGLYYQPPFYRELRSIDGLVSNNVMSQKSAHIVLGFTQDFYLGRNPKKFRFISEAYFKPMWDLISYDIDNVRIRYSGANDSKGYATGLDMRINGEFVEGAESWINFSFLRTRESLDGIVHKIRQLGEPTGTIVKDVPRPSDRFFNMSMFFQDYWRSNKNFKMHLNFTVGSGMPFGLPYNNIEYRNTYRYKPYHRVDIGFSYLLFDEAMRARKPHNIFRFTRTSWLSFEVFNLMQVQNQAGNTWVKTVFNQQYRVPNNLTTRRLNLRLKMDF